MNFPRIVSIRRLLMLLPVLQVLLPATPGGAQLPLGLESGAQIIIAINREKIGRGKAETTKAFSTSASSKLSFVVVRERGIRQSAEQAINIEELDGLMLPAFLQGAQASSKDILLYVHGYRSSVEGAVTNAVNYANSMHFTGTLVIFAWPSRNSLVAYFADVASADASTDQLIDLVKAISAISSIERIHVLAHSLGNDPVIKAVVKLKPSLRDWKSKLGELILCSPDVGREEFVKEVSKITEVVRGITLWASSSDRALSAANRVALRGVRAGQVPREGPIVMAKVDTVDVSSERRLWETNHDAYRQVDDLFSDLSGLLGTERTPPWLDPNKSPLARSQQE